MRICIKSIVAAIAFTLLAAAGAKAAELKAEVIHWWTSGGESAAVKVFADQFTKAGGVWVDTAIAGGANARTAAINRVVGGKPPTAMQFNTGKQFDDLVANDMLADLEAYAKEGNWRGIMPASFVEAATRNGKFYAVPVNIHGQNWLWYNKSVMEKAGVTPPTNFDDLFAALDKLKAAGVVPLAFGGQKNWERALFSYTLVGKGGQKLYDSVYGKRDSAAINSPGFREVADTYARLRGYVDSGSPGRNWNDATTMVIAGKAAMQFMGDWAKGEFTAAGLTPGKEYGCTVLGQGYMIGGDVFAMAKTKDPDQIAAQKLLAKVLVDPETQLKFAEKKGSVPVRLDLNVSSLDACAQISMKMAADPARQTPAMELLTPASVTGALEDVISEYWNTPSMKSEAFIAKFAQTLKESM
ncbi:MAG: carbohydrate ABC transporter substrate-binding protein [Proteobacteria bacterium]|nr:carbohydrate ABC transporter substrate-binding protein [Pseudomonadota bacterium]